MHQLLPPTYRDVWLEWRDGEQQQQEASRTAANKPRDQFISRLLTRLKQQQQDPGRRPQSASQGQRQPSGCGEDEPEESWEDLAGLDISEREEGVEEKSEKSGGRRGEAAALEAARELFLKQRESPLALKLRVNALPSVVCFKSKKFFYLFFKSVVLPFKAERERLPVFQHRRRVLEALQRHPVVVVAGETGSGKSTQVPQFLLEEMLTQGRAAQPCNIVVTQPRRISAMSLACRVSQELGCDDGPGSKVQLNFQYFML